jgi:hypothetical protein
MGSEAAAPRQRWRFVARPAGNCPRMVEFHDTIPHPHAQNHVPRHSGTRIFVRPFSAWAACLDLISLFLPGMIVWLLTLSVKRWIIARTGGNQIGPLPY